ncbi:undecaprenyldiphospho-muramoylpentapeptide beta-N-acetylglucosaminyltransferase [Stenotrophomonas sp.]|uniref:undecaprenyldiphospho-muramoylpentapeptide beta-N-acetylglucosaminyltransferase n=1 Tax=Stenotrophomonas sp. TaxID=69392 RepID=UPI0025E93895|nr:undecaprenyldiphospho-muramoylpentapeptide beta-N-acetylglucosaminyltransferase [Stenotrophomonas sp.]MBW8310803.1 undecaprenyldiphospho-muramoylpentapeptide beta-N-acetylglucosaminyltransferase [Rhizobium sp.]MBW8376078.1 undecaprenyldiphospho-muramoylpentapeptide beta-N-acetylglucosaminyltransferase [Stenotrophomonas sp.]
MTAANAPVLILAGGTGGHIFPGLAVAAALRERAVPVVWLGSAGGMETRLVPPAGIAIETISVSGLRGKGAITLLKAPFLLLRSIGQALAIVRRLRPRAVLSFGGYAAGPGGLCAWLLRRPLLVHEQNRAPGLTNRVLSRLARRVLCGFPGAFPAGRAEVVGNPVRPEIAAVPPPAVRLAGRAGPARLLVLGGSQGAHALNKMLPQVLAGVPANERPEVRHQCGERHAEVTRRVYAEAGVAASVEPFIADMAAAYAWADLVVCRAGALTLAELCAAGVGSVLVPFPAAVDDHQTRNAEYLVEAGAAVLVPEGEGFAERMAAAATRLLPDAAARLAMASAARGIAHADAAERVARIVLEEARA